MAKFISPIVFQGRKINQVVMRENAGDGLDLKLRLRR